jgi:hypothetical protein
MTHHLTPKEVYMIAFLTKHGWEPSYEADEWKKEGFTNKVPKESNPYWCYSERDMRDSEWFDLGSAYWEQVDQLEVDSKTKDDQDTIPSPPPEGVGQELNNDY